MVVGPDGLVGIVSERDVVRRLHEHGAEVLGRPVADIMTSEVITCTPDDTVDSLSGLMTTNRVRHVPVVENGQLAGIVSIGDVVKTRMEAAGRTGAARGVHHPGVRHGPGRDPDPGGHDGQRQARPRRVLTSPTWPRRLAGPSSTIR